MGLFSSIGRIVKGAVGIASKLPGPVGFVGSIGSSILGGGGSRPAALPAYSPPVRPAPGIPSGVSQAVDRLFALNPGYQAVKGIAGAFQGGSGGAGASYGAPVSYPTTVGHTGGLQMQGFGPQIMPVTTVTEARAPKGYRVHTVTPSTAPLLGMQPGAKVAVQLGSPAAKVLGVKRSKKPLVSVSETNAIRKAATAKRKLERAAKASGLHVYKNARRR